MVTVLFMQLKYHDTGREKECLPQVGQWNMMNKVCASNLSITGIVIFSREVFFTVDVLILVIYNCSNLIWRYW